jgi:hypothetical protein
MTRKGLPPTLRRKRLANNRGKRRLIRRLDLSALNSRNDLTVCTLELHDGLGDEVEGIRQFHRPFGLEVTIKIAHLIAHVQKCQGTMSPDLPKYPNSPRGSLGAQYWNVCHYRVSQLFLEEAWMFSKSRMPLVELLASATLTILCTVGCNYSEEGKTADTTYAATQTRTLGAAGSTFVAPLISPSVDLIPVPFRFKPSKSRALLTSSAALNG